MSDADPVLFSTRLRPHRSLSRGQFRALLLAVAAISFGSTLPFVIMGAWPVAGFMGLDVLAVYLAFRRNYQDGTLVECLRLWPDLITVERREPRGAVRRWHAHPAWVKVMLFENARIEKYLTLRGNGREIELGAFLSPDERIVLYTRLREALARLAP